LGFEIELDEFSGPLDLLCRLVETGEIKASRIRVSDLIRTYSAYLLVQKSLPFGTVSEFISLTARLLLGKVRGLFPPVSTVPPQTGGILDEDPDEILRLALERYRPFREAALILAGKLEERQKFKLRQTEDELPLYDFGDLFSLSRLWWDLLATKGSGSRENRSLPTDEMLGFESPEPDFLQIEKRIAELEEFQNSRSSIPFRTLFPEKANRRALVVTLLALLEMARLGRLKIVQEERFGELEFQFC
jgi:segregation and condensation protein A